MQSIRAIQNNVVPGGGHIGSDQAIFSLLNQTLTFNNLVATITDPRIKETDAILAYYSDVSAASAAGIQVSHTTGTVTFTATTAPSTSIVVNIYDIKPALANVWDSIGADEVSYDNTDSGLTAVTVQDAIDEVTQGSGTWTALTPVTGTTAIVEPSNYTEIMFVWDVAADNNYIFTLTILKSALSSGMKLRAGNDVGGVVVDYASGSFALSGSAVRNTTYTTSTITKAYYR